MNDHSSYMTRIDELLAEQALWGLDEADQRELDALLAEHGSEIHGGADASADSFGLTIAQIDLATGPAPKSSMPDALMSRIEQDIVNRMHGSSGPAATISPARTEDDSAPEIAGRIGPNTWTPWIIAAASLLLAAIAWLGAPTTGPQTPEDLGADRSSLMATAADLVQINWAALEDPSVTAETTGDVVWSDVQQRGYMRFSGLAVNDPTKEQYQLWIFDADRPDAHPVDGGVFDITEDGEVIVKIDPKIEIHEATMFAITVERPGGVVVSDRSRLPLLAAPATG